MKSKSGMESIKSGMKCIEKSGMKCIEKSVNMLARSRAKMKSGEENRESEKRQTENRKQKETQREGSTSDAYGIEFSRGATLGT